MPGPKPEPTGTALGTEMPARARQHQGLPVVLFTLAAWAYVLSGHHDSQPSTATARMQLRLTAPEQRHLATAASDRSLRAHKPIPCNLSFHTCSSRHSVH